MHFYIPPRSLKAHDHSPRAGNWRERERKGAKPTIARRLRPRWATLCASGKICAWWKTREIQREKKGTTTTTTHIPNLAQRTRRWYISDGGIYLSSPSFFRDAAASREPISMRWHVRDSFFSVYLSQSDGVGSEKSNVAPRAHDELKVSRICMN